MIEAVTFDLWDTLLVDDSDEDVRAERGLQSKKDERRTLFVAYVNASRSDAETAAALAWDEATAWFSQCWKGEHHTPAVRERIAYASARLGLPVLPGIEALIDDLEFMEVRIPPRVAPGVEAALDALAGRYRLGVVSDAIVTPGRGLRVLLEQHGLLRYFDHLVFSDEVGSSKPAPAVFRAASAGLRVLPNGIVHVGDREENDVAGPQAVGARAILFTGVVDRGGAASRADAVVTELDQIPGVLARWGAA